MQELRNQQIHPRNVAKAVSEGIIEKLNPVSITVNYPWMNTAVLQMYATLQKAVICLTSAVAYYELTTLIHHILLSQFLTTRRLSNLITHQFKYYFLQIL